MAKTKLAKKDDIVNEENILNGSVEDINNAEEIVNGEFEGIEDNEENDDDVKKDEEQPLEGVFNPSSLKGVKEDEEESLNKAKENKVKVRLNKDHKCCIGGERYYFKKDCVYTVNTNIKRILNKGGLLKPLS